MPKPAYRVEEVTKAFSCEPEQEEIISALAERDFRIFEVEQPKDAMVPYNPESRPWFPIKNIQFWTCPQ